MRRLFKVLVVFIVVAAVGDAVVHPFAYSRLEKADKCSCHWLNPQTTPLQELVFDPLTIAGIIIIAVGLIILAGFTVSWLRKRK